MTVKSPSIYIGDDDEDEATMIPMIMRMMAGKSSASHKFEATH